MFKTQIYKQYYPRKSFWKFWEKRRLAYIMESSDGYDESKTYDEKGTLMAHSIASPLSGRRRTTYDAGGQRRTYEKETMDALVQMRWDEKGNLIFHSRFDEYTGEETRYHNEGKTPSEVIVEKYNPRTGDYEKRTGDDRLICKGTLKSIYDRKEFAPDIDSGIFETGNMAQKRTDDWREDHKIVIDTINGYLAPTQDRQIAKRAIVRAFHRERN